MSNLRRRFWYCDECMYLHSVSQKRFQFFGGWICEEKLLTKIMKGENNGST
jgi:hypothetical protein